MKPPLYKKILLAILITIFTSVTLFKLLGYSYADSMYDADNVAKKLVQHKRSPKDCLKIKTFVPTYPPVSEFRASCIRTYAELTKDPTACELILPSDYGWSCLGAATERRYCQIGLDDEVSGGGIVAPITDCVNGPDDVKNNPCCIAALVGRVQSLNDCSSLQNETSFYNECILRLALKKSDVDICAEISNENLRTSCDVRVRTAIKYPDTCATCKKIVDTPQDLL